MVIEIDLNKEKYMDKFNKSELNEVHKFIKQGQFSILKGGIMQKFEDMASSFFGNKYGVSTCNGTAAIYLSLFSLNIQKGDEIILPVYAFHGIATAICCFGAKPVFCDIDPNTLTLDTNKLNELITNKTKAIMVLQSWGNLANVDEIVKIKKEHDLKIISDSSHAHGALWNGKPLGKYFDVIVASFGKGKLISGGELGVLTTDNSEIFERALLFSHVNRVPGCLQIEKYKSISNAVGLKFRPHGFALFLSLLQMKKFPNYIKQLRKNIRKLENSLKYSKTFKPIGKYENSSRVYWKFPIKMINKEDQDDIIKTLKGFGVDVESSHYKTLLSDNNIYTEHYNVDTKGDYQNAIFIKDALLQLPEFLFYYDENTDKIIKIFKMLETKKND